MRFTLSFCLSLALAGVASAQTTGHAAHHAATAVDAPAPSANVIGVVRAVDPKAGTLIIAHEPAPTLGWPAMTLGFKVADPALPKDVTVGAKIRFQVQGQTVVAITVL